MAQSSNTIHDCPASTNEEGRSACESSSAVIRRRLQKASRSGSCNSERISSATAARMSRWETGPLAVAKRLSRASDGKEAMVARSNYLWYHRGECTKNLSGFLSGPLPGSEIGASILLSETVRIESRESLCQKRAGNRHFGHIFFYSSEYSQFLGRIAG